MKDQNQHDHITIGAASSESVEISRGRLFLVIAGFILVFGIISLRVIDVSVLSEGLNLRPSNFIDGEVQVKHRADIVDRNGVLLAVNLSTASLYANPQVIIDVEEAAKKLNKYFPELDMDTLRSRLDSKKTFVWIKRNLTPKEEYEVNALGIPGLYFRDEEKRIYPHNELMAHVLGFINNDGQGVSGVERQFDQYLVGTDDVGDLNKPLKLSVDVRVQSVVHDVLYDALKEYNAIGASAVVMDVNTGEVVSMVSLPDFDLNNPVDKGQFNRATYGVYEMGSTFKTFNMALGFELGDISMKDKYDVSKPLKISHFTIRDYHPKGGELTIPEIFMYSSNIGCAKIAMDIGAENQRDFLDRLGLLSETDIELPERAMPLYPSSWGKISAMTISYGHGIAVTPIHMAKAMSSMVNGGNLHPATLLFKGKDDVIKSTRVISQATSDKVRKLMRIAVKYGTGEKADISGYLVGGKTGSADKPNKGRYNESAIISSFVAAFPMNKPKYTVFVMLDEPVGNKSTGGYATGGMIAAPAVGKIIERIAPILGVIPVDENNYEIRKEFWYEKPGQEVALTKTF